MKYRGGHYWPPYLLHVHGIFFGHEEYIIIMEDGLQLLLLGNETAETDGTEFPAYTVIHAKTGVALKGVVVSACFIRGLLHGYRTPWDFECVDVNLLRYTSIK